MNKDKMARCLAAGYSHWVGYEVYLPIADLWTETGYPTTTDAVLLHEAACERRTKSGEIRNWSILKLEV